MTSDVASALADRIDGDRFREWYREREWARNVREGTPYFNGPSSVPPPERHTPSSLVQCHRKLHYRKANAPGERPKPEGIFWVGRRFEADVIVPFLRSAVEDAYVRNSIWVDFDVETAAGPIRFKGSTDPCVVDRDAAPILPTEVKTTDAVDGLDGPKRHHRAQVHAYMHGLSRRFDRDVDEALLVYGSRETLNVRVFRERFDPEFWAEVVAWAGTHTEYRNAGELPPADPEYGWECRYCDYRHRCGRSDRPYADEDATGLLPGFAEYPRGRVVEHLRARDDATLTPTLARAYPDLAAEYDVDRWTCERCDRRYAWDAEALGAIDSRPPVCPSCADDGELATLRLAR